VHDQVPCRILAWGKQLLASFRAAFDQLAASDGANW
jgi:hypothetical protein